MCIMKIDKTHSMSLNLIMQIKPKWMMEYIEVCLRICEHGRLVLVRNRNPFESKFEPYMDTVGPQEKGSDSDPKSTRKVY